MTDRRIVAVFFPDLIDNTDDPKDYRELFWIIGRRQKMSDSLIAAAWERQYG